MIFSMLRFRKWVRPRANESNRIRPPTPITSRLCGLLAIAIVFATGIASQAADGIPQKKQPEEVDYSDAIDRLGQIVDSELQRGILSGTAVALVDDQRIVSARGFGHADSKRHIPAGPRSVYRAGSISKSFWRSGNVRALKSRRGRRRARARSAFAFIISVRPICDNCMCSRLR